MKARSSKAAWMLAAVVAASPALAQSNQGAEALLARLKTVEADPALSATALKLGAKVSTVCANCHGAQGYSTAPDTPNLAAQNPRYVLDQMQRFADGRRQHIFMQGLINAMNSDERVAAALYFSRQSVVPRPASDAALVEQGKGYYHHVCFRCHGADGHGSETHARLAGQQPSYVTQTLTRYRDGRATRTDPMMSAATKLMKDQEIRAVAAYVATMP